MYGGSALNETLQRVFPHLFPLQTPIPRPGPCNSHEIPSQVNWVGRDGTRPKSTAFLDFYIPDDNGSRFSQLNPKCLSMLPQIGNPLVIINYQI